MGQWGWEKLCDGSMGGACDGRGCVILCLVESSAM